MLKPTVVAVVLALCAVPAVRAATLLSENFDDVATLAASGWVRTNASTPVGTGDWFQGNDGVFAAQSGSAGSYIGANYTAGVDGGTLADWLISPTFSTAVAGTVSFWARADILAPYVDRIAVGFSTGSAATSAFALGAATTLGGAWTQYVYGFAAQGAGTVGRFAIEYVGLAGDANYVGVDSFLVATSVAAVPEPSTVALLGLGATGLAGVAVRRRRADRRAVP